MTPAQELAAAADMLDVAAPDAVRQALAELLRHRAGLIEDMSANTQSFMAETGGTTVRMLKIARLLNGTAK